MAITHIYSALTGDITIDFSTQIISCENSIVTLEIQELVDACREAEYSDAGIAFPKICNASGKDYLDVDNGVQVGITIVLLDGWRIYTEKNTGVFKVVGGNLVQVSGGDPFEPNPLVTYVNIQSAASTVVAVSSGSGLSTAEHNQLMAIPQETITAEQEEKIDAIVAGQAGQLTENRFIDLTFNRTNSIAGTGANKRITGYKAGEGDDVEVTVAYDTADEYALPESETVTP
jgi:hypothetical protein